MVALTAGCGRGPFDVPPIDPCEDEALCTSRSALQRSVDILFVIDSSGSMGDEQGQLARNFPQFIDVLEQQRFGASYRIGITTTDPWGDMRVSSCRERLDEFTFYDQTDEVLIDETVDGCLAQCSYDVVATVPTPNVDDPQVVARPWFEKNGETTNLADGLSIGEALSCAGPQGLAGNGFEKPLESMRAIFLDRGNATGFLRDEALLAVVFVTDETDCSMSTEHEYALLGDEGRTLWSDPLADTATSAVCWNAGTECEGGPGLYDDCHAVDKNLAGEITSEDGAVLYPVSRYVDAVDELAMRKASRGGTGQVLVAVIGGVPLDYPETGVMLFEDSDDPDFNKEYGIGPGCGRGTETVHSPPGIPPVRLGEFAEQFATEGRNLYSICSPDYTPALEQIVDALESLSVRTCVPGCVSDYDPDHAGLQPSCRLVERDDTGEALRDVPQCVGFGDAWTFPSTSLDLCYRALLDKSGATPQLWDDMSRQCVTQGANLELVIERPEGEVEPAGREVAFDCALEYPVGQTCDGKTPQ